MHRIFSKLSTNMHRQIVRSFIRHSTPKHRNKLICLWNQNVNRNTQVDKCSYTVAKLLASSNQNLVNVTIFTIDAGKFKHEITHYTHTIQTMCRFPCHGLVRIMHFTCSFQCKVHAKSDCKCVMCQFGVSATFLLSLTLSIRLVVDRAGEWTMPIALIWWDVFFVFFLNCQQSSVWARNCLK